MKILNFKEATNILGAEQGYQPLPVLINRFEPVDTGLKNKDGSAVMRNSPSVFTSMWKPSNEELNQLMAGHAIQLSVHAVMQPPVIISISNIPVEEIPMPQEILDIAAANAKKRN